MGLGRIFWIIIILFALVAMIISSLSPTVESFPVSTVSTALLVLPVQVYHDDYNNVTCWYTTQHNSSIYCISDSELAFQRSRLSFSEVVYFD